MDSNSTQVSNIEAFRYRFSDSIKDIVSFLEAGAILRHPDGRIFVWPLNGLPKMDPINQQNPTDQCHFTDYTKLGTGAKLGLLPFFGKSSSK
jgi:hypothetical protein